jgi:hypothetical protein
MSSRIPRHRGLRLSPPVTLVLASLVLAAMASAAFGGTTASRIPIWVPSAIPVDQLRGVSDLYYNGMAGRLVGADPSAAKALVSRPGAAAMDIRNGEAVYVYLVRDAGLAEFQPPARVLLRDAHEVLIATTGGTPMLTPNADALLTGLKQPRRIGMTPIVWPESVTIEEPEPPRDVDPLVQSMVNELTETNYFTTWQHLDDYETRYAYVNQNVQASQWIFDQFQAMGLTPEFHYYNDQGQKRSVVATLPGVVDPTRVVYICGHFDSTSPTPTSCAPGADDNATGSVAAIEAARVMKNYLFQYTVKFACFNGEEQGLYGSAAYVQEIANAGENVVGVIDCDMIAYRGNDAAPPDLVLYTNSASQALATVMANACNTYLPGQLQPLVTVSSLEGSDYASFWAHGYKAICAIEDEAWADDFCPWYHTCQDRIEQYPHDYVMSCARAALATTAITALPMNPSGPYLMLGSTQISDDNVGGSQGNGDGGLNPGETIEVYATVRNVGQAAAHHVSGTLTSLSADATVLTGTASWADIPAGGQGVNLTALRFRIAGSAQHGAQLLFNLTMHDDTGDRVLPITFNVIAPALRYDFSRIVDAGIGNGNGIPDPGESIRIFVSLANSGGQNAENVQAVLTSGNPHITVMEGTSSCALIVSGGKGELSPGYRVLISPNATGGEIISLNLAITAGTGYTATGSFKIKVGSAYWDDIEALGPWSLSATGDDATTGRWVQVDPNGTTYGTPAQQCQPEDDHTPAPGTVCFVTGQGSVGGAAGEADLDGGKTTLTTPTFDLSHVTDPVVHYWRWYTNNLGNNPNEDTWLVQVSNDGGTNWVDLERTTSSANVWTEKTFTLTSYVTLTTQMVIHFVASDTGSNSLIEAAIDDFDITGTLMPVAVEEVAQGRVLRLDAARPSPAVGLTAIGFTLPSAGSISLKLYGIDGRLVRTLMNGQMPAGTHRVDLDTHEIAPGIYFYKLNAGGRELSRRLVVIE